MKWCCVLWGRQGEECVTFGLPVKHLQGLLSCRDGNCVLSLWRSSLASFSPPLLGDGSACPPVGRRGSTQMTVCILRHIPFTLHTPLPEWRPFPQHIKEPQPYVLEIKAQVYVHPKYSSHYSHQIQKLQSDWGRGTFLCSKPPRYSFLGALSDFSCLFFFWIAMWGTPENWGWDEFYTHRMIWASLADSTWQKSSWWKGQPRYWGFTWITLAE